MIERIRKDFTTFTLAMMPVAIAINIAVGQLVYALKLPLYLDSLGTVLLGAVAGPWVGGLTGLITNLIWGLSGLNPIYTPFFVVGLVIGLLAGVFAGLGWFKQVWMWAIGGVITGVAAAIISAPIAAYMFGGVTGSGQDFIVGFFQAMGASVIQAALGQGIVSDPVDKGITFLVVWLIIIALPKRFTSRFVRAENIQD